MARNTSVTLGEHFDEFVLEIIKAGRFQSVSVTAGSDKGSSSVRIRGQVALG